MKKILFYFLIPFVAIYPASAQSSISRDCTWDEEASGYVLWTYKKSEKYISNYRSNFSTNWETHTRAIYLNNLTFLFLDSFFNANAKYKALNIHFCIYESNVADGQYDKNQFLLYFTPTECLEKCESNYSILEEFHTGLADTFLFPIEKINHGTMCPEYCDSSTSNWGYPSYNGKRLTEIKNGHEGILFYKKETIKENKNKYWKKTTMLGIRNRKRTRSLYVTKDKISRIAKFINTGKNDSIFPAIGVYFGSYNKRKHVGGQVQKKQITLGFTPMRKVNNYLEPDPCSYVNSLKPTDLPPFTPTKKVKRMAENHSELCPKKCPKEDTHL